MSQTFHSVVAAPDRISMKSFPFNFYKSEPMFTNNNENKMKSLIDTFGFPMSSAKVFDSIKANTVY